MNILIGFIAGVIALFGGIVPQQQNLGGQSACNTFQGCTGTSSPSGILFGDNGTTPRLSTVTIGSNLTFSGGTLSATGGSGGTGVGTIATSALETKGQLGYFTSTSGYPATQAGVATGTISGAGGVTVTAAQSVIGTGLTITCTAANAGATGCLSSTDWSTFNGKLGSYDPFTHSTNFNVTTSATTSPVWFQSNLYASTTPVFEALTLASTTGTSTIAGAILFGPSAATNQSNGILVDCTKAYPASITVGGCLNIFSPTTNTGTAFEVNVSAGASAAGRGIVYNQTNAADVQDFILASSSAGNTTVLNIKGAPIGKGLLKIEHTGSGGAIYANSSGISIDLLNATDAQGLFIKEAVGATGKPLNIVDSSSGAIASIAANGLLTVPYASTTALSGTTLCISTDCRTSWPAGGGGTGSGNVATSTNETSTQVPFWTSTSGSPATLGSDAGITYAFAADRLTVTYASSTGITATNFFTTNQTFTGLTSGALAVDANGLVYKGATTTAGTGLTASGGSFNVNSSQSIATLSNLSTNGFVRTSGSNGTLGVQTDPCTYAMGCTGTTTAPSGQVLYGGATGYQSVATSSVTFTAPLSGTTFNVLGTGGGAITCTSASAGVTGCLTGADYNTFTAKLGSYDAFTHTSVFGKTTSATSTFMALSAGLAASSTSYFDQIIIGTSTIGNLSTSSTNGNFTVAGNASTTNLVVSSAGGTAGCATFSVNGTISNTGTACGTGGGSSFGKAWEVDASGQLAPTTTIAVSIPTWLSIGDSTFAYASSTTHSTLVGLTAGGNIATTSSLDTHATVFGYGAFAKNNGGALRDTSIGYLAGAAITSGDDDVVIGDNALPVSTVSSRMIAIGSGAFAVYASATTNVLNTVMGYNVANTYTGGTGNTIIGASAGTLGSPTSGISNTIVGSSAGGGGAENTVIGGNSGSGGMTGDYNTLFGFNSGNGLTSGFSNTLIGSSLNGSTLSTGGGNLGIGNSIYFPSDTANNQFDIGNLLFGTLPATSTAFVLPTTGAIGVGTSSPFAKFSVQTNNGDTNTILFAIGSSTQSATTTLFSVSNTGLASTSNLIISGTGGTGTSCLQVSGAGLVSSTGSACGSGGGLSFYDAWTHPASGQSATTSLMLFNGNASTTKLSATTAFFGGTATTTILSTGFVGLASSTPFGMLSINPTSALGAVPAFVIGSSTATIFSITPYASGDLLDIATSTSATLNAFSINSRGEIVTVGARPALGACGTATISATSTDMRGTIVVTAGTPTTCNITFSAAKTDTPTCIVNDNSAALAVATNAASTTGVQFGMSAVFSGNLYYICMQ